MRYRILILLLALLATVQPLPAPVIVLPDSTPKPHATPHSSSHTPKNPMADVPAEARRVLGHYRGNYVAGIYKFSGLLTLELTNSAKSVRVSLSYSEEINASDVKTSASGSVTELFPVSQSLRSLHLNGRFESRVMGKNDKWGRFEARVADLTINGNSAELVVVAPLVEKAANAGNAAPMTLQYHFSK